MIKDSGTRREFESGAVRDIQEGKGRYDLMPWEAIHELALHCEQGANKYGERNCEKGIPIHSLIDSAIRHLSCYMRGMKDEPHLRAALWNIAFAIWTEQKHPDLQDIPARMGITDNAYRTLLSETEFRASRAETLINDLENDLARSDEVIIRLENEIDSLNKQVKDYREKIAILEGVSE